MIFSAIKKIKHQKIILQYEIQKYLHHKLMIKRLKIKVNNVKIIDKNNKYCWRNNMKEFQDINQQVVKLIIRIMNQIKITRIIKLYKNKLWKLLMYYIIYLFQRKIKINK